MRPAALLLCQVLLVCLVSSCGKRNVRPGSPAAEAARRAKVAEDRTECIRNVRDIEMALLMYSGDWGGYLPPLSGWEEVLAPYVGGEEVSACPTATGSRSYGFNEALAGMEHRSIRDPAQVIMVFDTDDGQTVACRHGGSANIGYADGHVLGLREADLDDARWSP